MPLAVRLVTLFAFAVDVSFAVDVAVVDVASNVVEEAIRAA